MRIGLVLALAGCGSTPRFERTMPAELPAAARASDHVRVEVRALPWWTLAGTDREFVLGLPAPKTTPTEGRELGAIRSRDVAVDAAAYDAIRCAWMIVPVGDPRPCDDRVGAMAVAQEPIHRAFDELRARAGAAGGAVAANVQCFAAREPERVWCEGTALDADRELAEDDAAAPRSDAPPIAVTRFGIAADASYALLGRSLVAGSAAALRYRPIEIALDMLDLSRSPAERNLFAVGGTALARYSPQPGFDVLLGGSAAAVAPNGAVNPRFTGLYQAFVGLGYQTAWRWSGVAQPFAQLRVGAAHDTGTGTTLPMVALHLGLASPER